MAKFIDITGERFGNLIAIERLPNLKGGVTVYRCLCDCGNETIVRANNLKSGAVRSCGCLLHTSKNATHRMSNTRIYHIWASMRSRCSNKNLPFYKNYGGRGISVCDEWNNSFETFYSWAINNGYRDGSSIERIDNDGNYCPENCKWIDLGKQANNRRMNKRIEYKGETHNLSEWCKILGVSYSLVHNRMNKLGWSFERAVETPCDIKKSSRKRE